MAKLVKPLTILQLVIESQRKKRKNAGQGNRSGISMDYMLICSYLWYLVGATVFDR